jgi:ribosomal protein L16 Arg81 hydroxylase
MDIVLEAGDVFYLPRGWWHEVTAAGDATFHLAVSTYPPYVTDYLNWLVEDISTTSEIYRAPVEPGTPADSSWEDLGEQLSEAIQSVENQTRFSQWFSSLQRLDSPYAIELFGNEKATPIPPKSRIFVNANNCNIWHGNDFIANGIRLKLNGLSKSIIKIITQHQGIQIDALVAKFPEMPGSRIEIFIIELIKQDVLAIHLPS